MPVTQKTISNQKAIQSAPEEAQDLIEQLPFRKIPTIEDFSGKVRPDDFFEVHVKVERDGEEGFAKLIELSPDYVRVLEERGVPLVNSSDDPLDLSTVDSDLSEYFEYMVQGNGRSRELFLSPLDGVFVELRRLREDGAEVLAKSGPGQPLRFSVGG